ncbi:kinase-like domain, phloem protein 2-like protein [Tanacetum coccineum]
MEGVKPSMIDMTMKKDKLSSLEDTTVLGSFPQLSTSATTSAGNVPGKSSYANITGKSSGKKVNVRTLFTPGGNGIDVVVPVDSIHAISERFANTAYGFFLGKKVAYPVVGNYVSNTWGKYGLIRSMFSSSTKLFSFQFSSMDGLDEMLENGPWSSYARVMVELRADVELKDNIVVAMPKITREGHYTCNVRVEYEWKPPRCSSCKVFGHIHEECTNNTGASEKKTVKKPSQTSRGVPIGPKIGFKFQKEYRPVTKKPKASSSGNKKNGEEHTIELDNDGNPLVPTGIVESDSEVEVVFDETANLRISTSGKNRTDKGYGTNIAVEPWRDFTSE